MLTIKLRMETGNVLRRKQPDQIAEEIPMSESGLQRFEKILHMDGQASAGP